MKSYMSFRLVPKSVTLSDVERRNGRYFALFQRIWVASGRTAQKFTFAISSPDEFLFIFVTFLNFFNFLGNVFSFMDDAVWPS